MPRSPSPGACDEPARARPYGRADVRAADANRQRAADLLGRAHVQGRLDVGEYDERLRVALAARTYGELASVTADLPADSGPPPAPSANPVKGRGMRSAVRAWATVSAINLILWAVVCLISTSWIYPWWIWVAGFVGRDVVVDRDRDAPSQLSARTLDGLPVRGVSEVLRSTYVLVKARYAPPHALTVRARSPEGSEIQGGAQGAVQSRQSGRVYPPCWRADPGPVQP